MNFCLAIPLCGSLNLLSIQCVTDQVFCFFLLPLLYQAFWYLEWHLDVLLLWALSCTGEVSKAEELLEGLKSRSGRIQHSFQFHKPCCVQPLTLNILCFFLQNFYHDQEKTRVYASCYAGLSLSLFSIYYFLHNFLEKMYSRLCSSDSKNTHTCRIFQI